MPVFLERFVLGVLVAVAALLLVDLVNPLNWDRIQQWSALGVIVCLAVFLAQTAYKSRNSPPKKVEQLSALGSVPPSSKPSMNREAVEPPRAEASPPQEKAVNEFPAPLPSATPAPPGSENDRRATAAPDRSVRIGDNSPISNSAIITGDNARIEFHPGPPNPWALTAQGQQKMAEVLSEYRDGEIALVVIGSGSQSVPSLGAAFEAARWHLEVTRIGQLISVGSPVDLSFGIHVMDNGAPAEASATIRRALESVGLKFESAPWQSWGNPKLHLALVIGNPQ